MYLIADYDNRYRPYDKSGGELRNTEWVKMPCKPKGDGLQALLEYSRGLEIFGIWCLLLQKATKEKKPENRGKLLNHKELPASIPEIAKGISHANKIRLVETAISVLVEMGWIINDSQSEVASADFRKTSAKSRVLKSRVPKSKYNEVFEKFWKTFKGRWNADRSRYDKGSKLEAWVVWQKLAEADIRNAMMGANKTGHKFTPDCCRWLKEKRWER